MGVENKGNVVGLSRRQLMRAMGVAVVGGAGAALQGCLGDSEPTPAQVVTVTNEKVIEKLVTVPVDKVVTVEVPKIVTQIVEKEVPVEKIVEKIVTVIVTPETTAVATATASATEAPKQPTVKAETTPDATTAVESPTAVSEVVETKIGEILLTNVPDSVDSNVVDVAKGPFKNTVGLGTEAFIAEPGGLLVGPDFGSKSSLNPYGENPQGWDAMYKSGGSIKPFSSVSQEIIRWAGEAYQSLPEGGFVFFSAGQMNVQIGDVEIEMPYQDGNNYFFVARGLYPDGKQDSDRNKTVKITGYKAGHIEVTMYESREKTNTAFVSEGQYLQKAEASHSGATSCGAEGCSKLMAVFYDVNTGALTIVKQVHGRFEDPAKGWEHVYSNWR